MQLGGGQPRLLSLPGQLSQLGNGDGNLRSQRLQRHLFDAGKDASFGTLHIQHAHHFPIHDERHRHLGPGAVLQRIILGDEQLIFGGVVADDGLPFGNGRTNQAIAGGNTPIIREYFRPAASLDHNIARHRIDAKNGYQMKIERFLG